MALEIPAWLGGNTEEKKQLEAENRERQFQQDQMARQASLQPSDDQVFFNMKQEEQNNTRWLTDLNDVNADLYLTLLGMERTADGDIRQTMTPLCSSSFIAKLKSIVVVGTSKTHSHTNYDDHRYAVRMQNIFHAVADLMAETHNTNGIDDNPANYSYVMEIIKTHVNNVAQRAINDRERLHNRSIYKESLIRTQTTGTQKTGLLQKAAQ